MPKISSIKSYKVVNSRGDWTLRTKVMLDDGAFGVETIPEGASKGENESVYIDLDKAIDTVNTKLAKLVKDIDPFDQKAIDRAMIAADGTPLKSKLGGNSIISVSLAVAKACANSYKLELYKYLNKLYNCMDDYCAPTMLDKANIKFPAPMFNVLNGGKHAHNSLSFQEFMVIPSPDIAFDKAYEMGVDIYQALKKTLEAKKLDIDVGDEGGFAPNGLDPRAALNVIKQAIQTFKKYKLGRDVFFGMDVAAGSFYKNGNYEIAESALHLTSYELLNYYKELLRQFELIYLEDPYYEKNFMAWQRITKDLGNKVLIAGDDLVVTNPKLLEDALKNNYCNAVIVKPNQVGTLTETFQFIRKAQDNHLAVCISHRSGDTAEDTFIADLAIAVGADFIKSGAPARGERVAKYNRLLEIFHSVA